MSFVVWFMIGCSCSVVHRHVRTSSLAIARSRSLVWVIVYHLRRIVATSWLLMEHDILFLIWLCFYASLVWGIHNAVSTVSLSSVHSCCRILRHFVLVCAQYLLLGIWLNRVTRSLADVAFIELHCRGHLWLWLSSSVKRISSKILWLWAALFSRSRVWSFALLAISQLWYELSSSIFVHKVSLVKQFSRWLSLSFIKVDSSWSQH